MEDLPLADLEPADVSVPVLLRHYLRMAGKVAAFNLDPKFSDALDALLVLDMRDTPMRLLKRYMGADTANVFIATAIRHA